MASSTRVPSPAFMRPSTTSWTVPSPPTTTRSVAPSRTASAASPPSWPGAVENTLRPVSPSSCARRSSSGHFFPVEPFAEAGLTRKTVVLSVTWALS
jgi:hypothetical protein